MKKLLKDINTLDGSLLIRSPNWLGDAVMSLPAIKSFKELVGSASLLIATPQKLSFLWTLCPFIDEILEMTNSKNIFENVRKLRKKKDIQMAVLFTRSFRTALECKLAGIPSVVGYGRTDQSIFLDKRIVIPKSKEPWHQAKTYLFFSQALGAKADLSLPPLQLPNHWRKTSSPLIVSVCPGAEYGPAKRWFPSHFAWVCRKLKEKYGCHIQILGGEKDRLPCEQLKKELPEAENLSGKTTLAVFFEKIFSSHLLLCNDSGAMHVGSLLQTPTVAIFGSTDPQKTAPIGGHCRIIYEKVDCSPCFLRKCPIDFKCMQAVEPRKVFEACDQLLSNQRKSYTSE
ncbi:lipopolysaccharide heptosyltransferase II [Candidatus Methylacidiphilum fumarolicum]|uniref:lipopolysaccharide heptosyltransferase II n=1 Tax=Candidatus Methylacidiphilum fumarolicum TaxID=591154 RepID=UPI001069AA05|nr:lipopolysaccharide heptosyltransferase II [Candidatus Methylacidiphilum fumarolicum]TFE75530.1 lipopolysaccharide heptosyltransferase II [Candidatus Methylacidiphilum fumarolicum]